MPNRLGEEFNENKIFAWRRESNKEVKALSESTIILNLSKTEIYKTEGQLRTDKLKYTENY